jgi:hypothetical protein
MTETVVCPDNPGRKSRTHRERESRGMSRDTYQVVLWNPNGRGSVDRVLDTFVGDLDAREEAVKLASTLSTLKEQLIMLGVMMSAPYEIRIKQERRTEGAGGLYPVKRARWLGYTEEPNADEEAKFWGDPRPELEPARNPEPIPDEVVHGTIATGNARVVPHNYRYPATGDVCDECALPESHAIHYADPLTGPPLFRP